VEHVWDKYKKEHVMIKVVLIATITDLLGQGCLSGKKTKGYTGCIDCLDDTDAVYLKNNPKLVYMGHCKFLPMDHPYCRNKKYFDGTIDRHRPPNYRDGPEILRELNKLEVVLGKGNGARAAPDKSIWKKKLVFWKLPYWPVLSVATILIPCTQLKMCALTRLTPVGQRRIRMPHN